MLDAAGGSGEFVDFFLAQGAERVMCADFSQVAVESVAARYLGDSRVTAHHLDLTMPWEGVPACDVAVVLEAIQLLPSDAGVVQAMANLASVVRPGGTVVISDVFPRIAYRENAYVVRRSRGFFEATLDSEGFDVLGYVPQTFVFNRRLFGPLQPVAERLGTPLYWVDQLALRAGLRPPADSPADTKYLVARRRPSL